MVLSIVVPSTTGRTGGRVRTGRCSARRAAWCASAVLHCRPAATKLPASPSRCWTWLKHSSVHRPFGDICECAAETAATHWAPPNLPADNLRIRSGKPLGDLGMVPAGAGDMVVEVGSGVLTVRGPRAAVVAELRAPLRVTRGGLAPWRRLSGVPVLGCLGPLPAGMCAHIPLRPCCCSFCDCVAATPQVRQG